MDKLPKKTIECYEVTAIFTIRKSYWDIDNDKIDEEIIKDRIQQGIEVPLEDICVKIIK